MNEPGRGISDGARHQLEIMAADVVTVEAGAGRNL